VSARVKSYVIALVLWETVVLFAVGLSAIFFPSYNLGEALWPNNPRMSIGTLEGKPPSPLGDNFLRLFDTALSLTIAQDMVDRGLGLMLLGPLAALYFTVNPIKPKGKIYYGVDECEIPYTLK